MGEKSFKCNISKILVVLTFKYKCIQMNKGYLLKLLQINEIL